MVSNDPTKFFACKCWVSNPALKNIEQNEVFEQLSKGAMEDPIEDFFSFLIEIRSAYCDNLL